MTHAEESIQYGIKSLHMMLRDLIQVYIDKNMYVVTGFYKDAPDHYNLTWVGQRELLHFVEPHPTNPNERYILQRHKFTGLIPPDVK